LYAALSIPEESVLKLYPFALAVAATLMSFASPVAAGDLPPYDLRSLSAGEKLPASIKVQGKQRLQVWTWNEYPDVTGYAVFSQTETANGDHVTGRELFVQLYTGKGDAQKQVRLVRDGVRDCELDVVAQFVDDSIQVTDMDRDYKVELSFAYDLACKGDISPNVRKLLVLEGKDKHALRGTSRLAFGNQVEGGTYKLDGFKNQRVLKEYAEKQWKELLAK
jgi:hypothetical protein